MDGVRNVGFLDPRFGEVQTIDTPLLRDQYFIGKIYRENTEYLRNGRFLNPPRWNEKGQEVHDSYWREVSNIVRWRTRLLLRKSGNRERESVEETEVSNLPPHIFSYGHCCTGPLLAPAVPIPHIRELTSSFYTDGEESYRGHGRRTKGSSQYADYILL